MKRGNHLFTLLISIVSVLGFTTSIKACTTVLVGKKASEDGAPLIARNEDLSKAWAKYFEVYPGTNNGPTQYVSQTTGMKLSLPKDAQRYTGTPDWQKEKGQQVFLEDGINASNIAMSATESTATNKKAMKADPFVKNGITEADMLPVVLPYINSAKQGVERMGKIVEQKGAVEPDGVIFSDKDSIWYMEIVSGHQWAAVRVPDDKAAVIPNQSMIGQINPKDSQNYLCSKGLIKLVKNKHLGGYDKGKVTIYKAFGTNNADDQEFNKPRTWDGQRILDPNKKQSINQSHFQMFVTPAKKVSVEEVAQILGSHFNGTKYNSWGKWEGGYRPINSPINVESHILEIRSNVPADYAALQWLCMASPATSVYVPFYTNINNTPSRYKIGTDKYDNKSAYWTYKETSVLIDSNKEKLDKKYVVPIQNKVNKQLRQNIKNDDRRAKTLNGQQLQDYLTNCNQQNADYAQNEFNKLNGQLITGIANEQQVVPNSNEQGK